MPEIITPPAELFAYFKKRTLAHIEKVAINLYKFGTYYKNRFEIFDERAAFHDKSKFEKPESPGFVWLNSYYWLQKKQSNIEYTKNVDKQIDIIFEYLKANHYHDLDRSALKIQLKKQLEISLKHHYKHNRHHPEFHKNLNTMIRLDMIEMVCDWTAIAQELGQDNGSARGWADKVIPARFGFSDEQIAFIYECIEFLEKNNKHIFICKRGKS